MYSRTFLGVIFLFLLPIFAFGFTLSSSNMKGWSKEEIRFRFNPSNCSISSERIESAIRASVDLWNSVPTSRLRVSYMGHTSESGDAADPIVSCSTTGLSGAVGVGIVSISGGVIQSAEIRLNSQSGDSSNISNVNDDQLQIAIAHEMGHVFGLGHSEAESSLMYFSLGSKQRLSLSQDDVDGLTWLYPRDEVRDGVMGCGSLEGSSFLGLMAFGFLLLLFFQFLDSRTRLFWRPQ